MRIKASCEDREADMTPMIDITFLLISFFVFLLNFSEAEQDARIKLPTSELAIPSKSPPSEPIALQIMQDGTILFNNSEYGVNSISSALSIEGQLFGYRKVDRNTVTVLLRGDGRCSTGLVQDVMQKCQQEGFEIFKLITISKEDR